MRLLWVVLLSAGLVLPMGPNAKAGPTDEAWQAHAKGDYARAWTLAIPPALDGQAGAQHLIGTMLFEGQGTEQDRCLATLWFDKAARRGHVDAQYRLGMAFAWGYGVYRLDREAQVWLLSASRAGHLPAKDALAEIRKRVPPGRNYSDQELSEMVKYIGPAEYYYYPVPGSLLNESKLIARNWFSPCNGHRVDNPPTRRDDDLVGLPSLDPGLTSFRNGDYQRAFDELLAGGIYARPEAIDILTMLTMTGRVGPEDRCLGAIWASKGLRIPRPMATLTRAFANGWGFRRDEARAYALALWVHQSEPSALDIREFERLLDPRRRKVVADNLENILRDWGAPETFIFPDAIRKANPGLMPGLAPCRADQ